MRCLERTRINHCVNNDDFKKLVCWVNNPESINFNLELNGETIATCDALQAKLKTMYANFYADDEANIRIREQIAYLRKLISAKRKILGE